VPVSVRRRRQESPILREERDISRKAIAQGMSDRLRCPVCSCAIFFSTLCTRDRGCSAHPAFPAPSLFRGTTKRKPRASPAARMRMCGYCLTFESMGSSSRTSEHRERRFGTHHAAAVMVTGSVSGLVEASQLLQQMTGIYGSRRSPGRHGERSVHASNACPPPCSRTKIPRLSASGFPRCPR